MYNKFLRVNFLQQKKNTVFLLKMVFLLKIYRNINKFMADWKY